MEIEVQRIIPADHLSLAGHFPGNPIVPGVLILDEVVDALEQLGESYQLQGFSSVKFSHPLRPDQPFYIHLTISDNPHQAKFRCTLNGQLIAQGQMEILRCSN